MKKSIKHVSFCNTSHIRLYRCDLETSAYAIFCAKYPQKDIIV